MNREETARRLLDALKRGGAVHASARISEDETCRVSAANGEAELISSGVSCRAHLKVQRAGACFEKDYALNGGDSLQRAIDDALAGLASARPDPYDAVFAGAGALEIRDLRASADPQALLAYLSSLASETRAFPGASLAAADLSYRRRFETLCTDSGMRCDCADDGYALDCRAVLTRGGAVIDPFRLHRTFRSLSDVPRFPGPPMLADNAELLFSPVRCPARFEGSWIVAPETLYYALMDFLFGQLFEDNVLAAPTLWSGRLGQRVAAEGLTLRFDPLRQETALCERITQDGLPARPFTLIKNGVLKNLICGERAARRLGIPAPGNTSDSLILEPGAASLDALIGGVERGLLTFAFSGNCRSDGGFSGVCGNSFFLRDGRITSAADSVSVSGSWPELLGAGAFALSAETGTNGEFVLPWARLDGVRFA